jgi:hypothetical protein
MVADRGQPVEALGAVMDGVEPPEPRAVEPAVQPVGEQTAHEHDLHDLRPGRRSCGLIVARSRWPGYWSARIGHSSPIPTTGGRGGKCRTGSRAGALRDSWPAGGCEARRTRRPGPMIVKTVNFLSCKRSRRKPSENCRRIRQETGIGAIPSVCQRIKW